MAAVDENFIDNYLIKMAPDFSVFSLMEKFLYQNNFSLAEPYPFYYSTKDTAENGFSSLKEHHTQIYRGLFMFRLEETDVCSSIDKIAVDHASALLHEDIDGTSGDVYISLSTMNSDDKYSIALGKLTAGSSTEDATAVDNVEISSMFLDENPNTLYFIAVSDEPIQIYFSSAIEYTLMGVAF